MRKAFLFSIILITWSCSTSQRSPASADGDCFELMQSILGVGQKSDLSDLYRKLMKRPLDQWNDRAYEDYFSILEREGANSYQSLPDSPESIVAMIDFMGAQLKREPLTFESKKKKQAIKLIEKLKRKKKFEFRDVEAAVDDLLDLRFPERFRFGSDGVEAHLQSLLHRDLVRSGLESIIAKYAPENIPRWTRFRQSKWGELFATSFWNLPVLTGMPPLYLPAAKVSRLSDELAQDILHNGLSDEVLKKVKLHYYGENEELFSRFHGDYQFLRKRYLTAIGVYLSAYFVWDFYREQKEITQEAEKLDQMTEDGQGLLDMAKELEAAGVSIFDEPTNLQDMTENRF
ncbi:MAG: hypothetical protein CO099_01100, partial [Bdellovibrio sp. CG_4_9_14_3_um_filter_39_7]